MNAIQNRQNTAIDATLDPNPINRLPASVRPAAVKLAAFYGDMLKGQLCLSYRMHVWLTDGDVTESDILEAVRQMTTLDNAASCTHGGEVHRRFAETLIGVRRKRKASEQTDSLRRGARRPGSDLAKMSDGIGQMG